MEGFEAIAPFRKCSADRKFSKKGYGVRLDKNFKIVMNTTSSSASLSLKPALTDEQTLSTAVNCLLERVPL
jgi:hypothetical protein